MTYRNTHGGRALTALQQSILDILWAQGPVTAETVREALAPARPLKDSTIRTLLRRLEARQLVTHTVDGKVFKYKAAVRPHRLAARAVRHIIERFCAGSVDQFLLGMVDEKVLSPEEIRRLARKVGKDR